MDDLSNKTVTCSKLKDADFEKIGEYFMGKALGDTQNHINMNNMMKNMMGEKGEENMHISLGRQATGCTDSGKVGFTNMMGWYGAMMEGGYSFLGLILWAVVLIDLVLLGVFLWKKIQK